MSEDPSPGPGGDTRFERPSREVPSRGRGTSRTALAPRDTGAAQGGARMREEAPVRDTAHLYDPSGPDFDEFGETRVDDLIAEIITSLGEDVSREGMLKTPQRVERSLRFLTSGYEASIDDVVNGAVFGTEDSEMVIVKGIEFYSLCEHHMLPFFGHAHIAYIPNDKILGLSKFARIVDVFARRMQVQERMTAQIADSLQDILEPQGVAVVTEASHLCMMMRGVEKQGSTTRTSAMRGVFRTNDRTRHEFLQHLRDAG